MAMPSSFIEVKIGEIIDPGTFRMVTVDALTEVLPMEKVLTRSPGQDLDPESLRKGLLISVYSDKENMWLRGQIEDIYYVQEGKINVDVILMDHGLILRNVSFPQECRRLPECFSAPPPFQFEFKLNGKCKSA